jgi:hypothetical protein
MDWGSILESEGSGAAFLLPLPSVYFWVEIFASVNAYPRSKIRHKPLTQCPKWERIYLDRECAVLLKLNEKYWLPIVSCHQLALSVQTPTGETLDQVVKAFPLDTNIGREYIVADSQSDRHHELP